MKEKIIAFAKANPLRAAVVAVIIIAALGGFISSILGG